MDPASHIVLRETGAWCPRTICSGIGVVGNSRWLLTTALSRIAVPILRRNLEDAAGQGSSNTSTGLRLVTPEAALAT